MTPFFRVTIGPWLSAGLELTGPDLLGMGGLTSDEDFGEGRGLTVGILHQHSVGA